MASAWWFGRNLGYTSDVCIYASLYYMGEGHVHNDMHHGSGAAELCCVRLNPCCALSSSHALWSLIQLVPSRNSAIC
jgi:hypothetical protein